jgi:hypothetical protein
MKWHTHVGFQFMDVVHRVLRHVELKNYTCGYVPSAWNAHVSQTNLRTLYVTKILMMKKGA